MSPSLSHFDIFSPQAVPKARTQIPRLASGSDLCTPTSEVDRPSQATQKAKPRQATPNYAKSRIAPPQLRRHKTTTTQDDDRYKTTDKTRIYTMP